MKEKNKGFTLVELLAVIVILAIIALIATPIILNVISDAKKQAALESFKGYIDGAEKAIALNELEDVEDPTFPKADDSGCYKINELGKKINIKGKKPEIDSDAKVCFQNGEVTSISGLAFSGYEVKYTKDKGYEMNGKVVEKDNNKELVGIASKEYTQGEKVSYLGYNWLVMKDNGASTQLVMDGYLSADELKANLPSDVDSSQLKSSEMRLCLHKESLLSNSDYSTVKDAFIASAGNYCYNIWNGEPNEYREYTWNTSIVKPTIENWLDNKMKEKGLAKDKELVGMAFNDGISSLTGYVRIPTYDDVESIGAYNTKDNTNYMSTEYDYFLMTFQTKDEEFSWVYFYHKSVGVSHATSASLGRIRPVITVNEK